MNRSQILSRGAMLAACSASVLAADAAPRKQQVKERPNILWLTFEDTSWFEAGCYGNDNVHTPCIDSLARMGVRFTEAWSVAPQSSPARSTLITGCCAPTYGMDLHPVQQLTPDGIFFPQYLRDAGYYCTNNFKTHYNTKVDNTFCWDECDKFSTYLSPDRKEGQPFFAVFNSHTTHMGRVRTFHTDGRRDFTTEGIQTRLLPLPEYLPDLPEIRSDYAAHLEGMQDVDRWVGTFLENLREEGLADNTIIFVFSDHGGCLPRGKGYLYETGLKVPLVVYFPPKWRHLAGDLQSVDSRLISFADLGPSVLSLAGVKPPKTMEGRAQMGEYAVKEHHEYIYAFGSNQLHHYLPVRAVRDSRYKLIRSYIPYRQFALRNYYQWGMPSNMAWDEWVLGDHCRNELHEQPFGAHPAKMLFDLENDPWELHNLADDPAYASVLERLDGKLEEHLLQTRDLGFFLPSSREGVNVWEKANRGKYPLEELQKAAGLAGVATLEDLPKLEEWMRSESADMRYWGVVGMVRLLPEMKGESSAKERLAALMDDEDCYVAAEAAYACAVGGIRADEAAGRLVTGRDDATKKVFYSALECLSLDEAYRPLIMAHVERLKADADRLPARANEDAGLMARGVLVNLGLMTNFEIYGEDAYRRGLNFNHGRREMGPDFHPKARK